MTVHEHEFGPFDWLERIRRSVEDGLNRYPRFQDNINYRELTDLAREIQDAALKMEQKAIMHWRGYDRTCALRIETVSQDAVWNEKAYNDFSSEARQKKLEIVMLIEAENSGYHGPAVILEKEPEYIQGKDHNSGRHPLFKICTLRREFNGKWLLYPDRW